MCLVCFVVEKIVPGIESCEPFALASGLNRMPLDLAIPNAKTDAKPDASAFGSLPDPPPASPPSVSSLLSNRFSNDRAFGKRLDKNLTVRFGGDARV